MTTVITIEHGVSEEAMEKARRFVEHERLHNPNWSDTEIRIERGDQTTISGPNSFDAVVLLTGVMQLIWGPDPACCNSVSDPEMLIH